MNSKDASIALEFINAYWEQIVWVKPPPLTHVESTSIPNISKHIAKMLKE